MFTQFNPAFGRSQRWIRFASLAFHGVALAWLLHAPTPRLLTPSSVALGQNGTSVTRLYWSTKSPDDSAHSSSEAATQRYRHERFSHKLTWKQALKSAKDSQRA